jgi:Ca-activated chloride channel family protein
MKTRILMDHEPVADGGWLLRALLKIEGTPRTDENRVRLNLSIVLDKSGSMAGEKLEAAKEAARSLAQRLWPEDMVSVVTYDESVHVVAHPATGEAQAGLSDLIAAIYAGSTTNLSGGWLKGRDFVAANRRDGAVNRVLILTDGLANVGITEPAKLTGLCRTAAANGITTTTIGFGAGFNEDLLTAMSDGGGGAAYYIEHPDQAPGVFDEELEGLLSISAQNLTVRLEPTAGNECVQVWHEYPSTAEGDTLVLSIGDLYAREARHVLAEFLLKPAAEGAEEAEIDVATFVVTAQVLREDGSIEQQEVTLPVKLSPVEGGYAEPTVRKEMLHLQAARERRQALEDWDRGDYVGARQRLQSFGVGIANSPYADDELREEAADFDRMAARSAAHLVSEEDRKYMHLREHWSTHSKRKAAERVSRVKREEEGKKS